MKEILYDRKSTGGRTKLATVPIIRITFKLGRVSLNEKAVDMLMLRDCARILFIQDQDNPRDWYIMKTNSINGFELRNYKFDKFNFVSKKLTESIRKSLSLSISDHGSTTFLLATQPTITAEHYMYAIITKNI